MKQIIGLSTVVVHEYDEAIDFFVGKLGFRLVEDMFLEAENKRWVVVAPKGSKESGMLLAKASDDGQIESIGTRSSLRAPSSGGMWPESGQGEQNSSAGQINYFPAF